MKKIKNSLQAMGALLALSLLATPVSGAPITFAFEAEISSVVKTQGADFNLAVNEGDKFTGTFTFEPVSLPPLSNPLETQNLMVAQPYTVLFEIAGNTFRTPVSTESLKLAGVNNAHVSVRTVVNGSTHEELQFQDRMELAGSLISQNPDVFPGLSASSHFSMDFWGRQSLLDAAGFPESAMVWNEFDFQRELQVVLVDSTGHLVINAKVGEISAVPEPGVANTSLGLFFAGYDCLSSPLGSTTDLRADGNDDGVIDAADYTLWQQNFGLSLDLENVTV